MSLSLGTQPAMSRFLDDPLVSPSGQFALATPAGVDPPSPGPSPVGLRPWGLRRMGPVLRPGTKHAGWRYDNRLQVAVTADGEALLAFLARTSTSAGPPTAPTTPPVDGEDPPSSEDYVNDYHQDHPYQP